MFEGDGFAPLVRHGLPGQDHGRSPVLVEIH
jgi:hypothetical protein